MSRETAHARARKYSTEGTGDFVVCVIDGDCRDFTAVQVDRWDADQVCGQFFGPVLACYHAGALEE